MAWITPRDAVASKLMQSTASMITRPAVGEEAPLEAIARSTPPGKSLPMRSADTTRRRRPLIVTVNFSGPRSGTGRPSLSMTWTSTATTSTATRKGRRRILIGTLRVGGRGSLGRDDRGAGQDRGGQN